MIAERGMAAATIPSILQDVSGHHTPLSALIQHTYLEVVGSNPMTAKKKLAKILIVPRGTSPYLCWHSQFLPSVNPTTPRSQCRCLHQSCQSHPNLASGLPVDDGGVRLADEDRAGAVLLTHLHAVTDNRLKRRVTENNKTGLKAKISGPPCSKAKFIKRTTSSGEDLFFLFLIENFDNQKFPILKPKIRRFFKFSYRVMTRIYFSFLLWTGLRTISSSRGPKFEFLPPNSEWENK